MTARGRRHAALVTLAGNGATVAITIGQAFLLIPLALAQLGTHLYGAWLAAYELLVWVQLLDLGIPNLLTQRIGSAVGSDDRVLASRWSGTGLALLLVIAALLTGVSVGLAPMVTVWTQAPSSHADEFTACFRVGVLASALLLVCNGVVGIARGVQLTGLVNATQVAGAFTSLGVTVALLMAGLGIWALPLGLLARALVTAGGAGMFLFRSRAHAGLVAMYPSKAILRETIDLAPSMAAASAGYLAANNTEILIVTTVLGPVAAAVYSLTRRTVDAVRSLLDSVAWAVYGGFAHLVTADDRHRARAVFRDILWLRLAAASVSAAIVVAVNEPFVTLLFGAENFGGVLLTTVFAIQMIVGGQAFLSNYLLRAAGRVREGSYVLGAEALLRVAATTAGLLAFGLAGGPALASLVSAIVLFGTVRYTDRELPDSSVRLPSPGIGSRLAPVAVLGVGIVLSLIAEPRSWAHVVLMAMVVCSTGTALLWLTAPPLRERSLLRWNRS